MARIKAALRKLEDVDRQLAESEAEVLRLRAKCDEKRREIVALTDAFVAAGGTWRPF